MRTRTTLAVAALFAAGALPVRAADPADVIYHGGDIITIDDKNPTAEAVAVKDGKIVAVGTKADILKRKGDATRLIDLGGRTMLPGFIDAHGHCFNVGFQAASANLLPPPDYTIKDIASLQAELKKWAEKDTAKKFQFIVGFGYDDAQYFHPTSRRPRRTSQRHPHPVVGRHPSHPQQRYPRGGPMYPGGRGPEVDHLMGGVPAL